ncbi:MAG: hypothetical protein WCT11_03650 [Candidatus Magasanikbacteria bacterium]|jgi:Tfp pilus assembly protein PilV
MLNSKNKKPNGFSLIEIILSSGLLGMFALAFLGVLGFSQESTLRAGQRSRAIFLAEEGVEAVRSIRDENFANLTVGEHGLIANNKWNFTNQPDIINEFTRTLTIADINSQTKQVVSQVSWKQSGGNQVSVSFSTLFTDWRTATSAGTSTQFCGI